MALFNNYLILISFQHCINALINVYQQSINTSVSLLAEPHIRQNNLFYRQILVHAAISTVLGKLDLKFLCIKNYSPKRVFTLYNLKRTLPLDTSLRNRACMMMYPTLSATNTHRARTFFIAPSRTLHTLHLLVLHLQILNSFIIF